jgi:hypothetical protein
MSIGGFPLKTLHKFRIHHTLHFREPLSASPYRVIRKIDNYSVVKQQTNSLGTLYQAVTISDLYSRGDHFGTRLVHRLD